MNISGVIKTEIICNEDRSHVYEITKDLGVEGEEIILLSLYPTITEVNSMDLSTMHMINHCSDEGLQWGKIHFVYLFSKVAGSKLSTRGLVEDKENLEYVRKLIAEKPHAKIVIAFGSSMERCPAAIASKVNFFAAVKELRPKEELWQLDAIGMEEESPHMLFAGIRYGNCSWGLRHYIVPYRYTPEGYQSYLVGKEAARERFIQNVLGRKQDELPKMEEKQKKGKKKNEDTESK